MRLRLTSLAILLCLLPAGCGSSKPQPQFSPEAEQILAKASEFYRQHRAYRVHSRLQTSVADESGVRVVDFEPMVSERVLAARASGEYLVTDKGFRLAREGEWVRLNPTGPPPGQPPATKPLNVYWKTRAPDRPDQLVGLPIVRLFGGPAGIASLCFCEPGLAALVRPQNEHVGQFGETTINGRRAHHLVIAPQNRAQSNLAVPVTELWIAAEGDPLVLQLRHTPPAKPMKLDQQELVGSIVTDETFDDWQFDADEPAETFAAPAGARRVAELAQLVRAPSPLLGQPAPEFALKLLDGTSVAQASLLAEQKILMLDFWATWCKPCRMEMPLVAKLAQEFAAEGVVLFAVNQQEPRSKVVAFQSEQSYKFTPVLDESGSISDVFNVTGLPQLCLLGRDGTIQAVHVGVGEDTEQAIREELAALIAGRNIAAQGLPD